VATETGRKEHETADRSYRALLALPSVRRLLIGMQIARIGQAMMSVTFVLFTLDVYHSAKLSGMATFFSIFPGLVVSPIAGTLLDRHGRIRLVVLDYLVALGSLTLIGVLALTGTLPAWLLMTIAAVASLTTPLSSTGLRSLFPFMVPRHLWERVNALDSTGYVMAVIVGPPLAAGLVAIFGGAVAFIVIGLCFGVSAIVVRRLPELSDQTSKAKPLLAQAWDGVVYTWRNPTLRGLGFCMSTQNLLNGVMTIVVPVIVLERLHLGKTLVGLVFAIQGVSGMLSAIVFGRGDSRNRERMMLTLPMLGGALTTAALLLNANLPMLVLVMAVTGFLNGPLDIAMFTLRQRRTDTAWMGRAFAISMSVNYLGIPIGSMAAGILVSRSISVAITFAVVSALISAALAVAMIPSRE